MKNLLSLVLVLALATMASAIQWTGPSAVQTAGDWNVASNWGGTIPTITDIAYADRSDGAGGNVYVATVGNTSKLQMKFGVSLFEIKSGGTLNCEGSVEQGKGTSSIFDIRAGGIFNAAQKLTQTTGTYKMASAAASTDTVNVYGTLNVKGSLANSDIQVGYANTTGNAYVNVFSGGMFDVDVYAIASRGLVTIYNGGTMKIKGDVTTQTNADITAGRIVGGGGATLSTYATGGYTYVVPEPATVALLGLGALLLRRKK